MVNFNSTMPLTISFLSTQIPLPFLFFLYLFHCLLLPPHFPINRGLLYTIQITTFYPRKIPFHSLHIQISWFHSLISKVSQCFKEERRRLHHHHQPLFNAFITITTSSSWLWITCGQGFKSSWSRVHHAIHLV